MNTGDRIGGHFEILEKLGAGGMGEVWKARDTRLNRIVAIKTLKNHTERFEREARAIAALNHPHICAIYDVGPDYLVMEYVEGMPPKRPLPVNEVLRLGAQVADALAAAHAAGITHRDLKPDNILVTKDGRAKVLDFGLAKLADSAPGQDEATRTIALTDEGTIVGTAPYMSPEQAEGKKTDTRSDIFSLGAVLYELLTGKRAFEGDSKMSILAAVLREEPKPISEVTPAVPAEVAKLIAKMMRKDAERRVQSMADVKLTLQDLRDESSSGAIAAAPPPKRKRWPLLAAVAAVVVAGAIGWMKRAAPVPESPSTLIQLTSFPGREITPALSPDGRQIAFAWDGDRPDGTFDIYLKLVDAGSPVRLTTHPASDTAPAWSPDGTHIAFHRDGSDQGIYVVPVLGGKERRVASLRDPLNPTMSTAGAAEWHGAEWSADGKSLFYVDDSIEPWIIRWVALNGERQGQLPPAPAGYWGDRDMAISPDGRAMAFRRPKAVSVTQQMLLKLGESFVPEPDPRILPGPYSGKAAWMPDSQALVLSRQDGFLDWIPVNGGSPRRIEGAGSDNQFPSVARYASRLAFVRAFSDTNIWRIDLQAPKPVPSRVIASSRSEVQADQASKDGRIVFRSSRSGTFQLWIADPDGSNAEPLTTNAEQPAGPRLSPDGKWVVFAARPQGNVDIYLMESRGGAIRRLTNAPGEDHSARFSRDGQWIYFCSDRTGKREVWKMPANGSGEATQVTRNGGWVTRESADRQWLYFSKDNVSPSLFRIPIGGGPEEVVVPRSSYAQWDVSDKGIYYVDEKEIRFFRFADHKTETILQVPQIAAPPSGLALSADGRFLIYPLVDSSVSDIMLLDNFHGY